MKHFYVYIMSNRSKTLYIGVTSDLVKRVYEHKKKLKSKFTTKYKIDLLVYYEETTDVEAALTREKQLKGWSRRKKLDLLEAVNPGWHDLRLS